MNCITLLAIAGMISSFIIPLQTGDSSRVAPPPISGDVDYHLGPGDVIQVFVWKEADLTATAMVRPDGKISLPLINELNAEGRTVVELQEEVSRRLQRYLKEPVVSVILKEVNAPKVSVLGNVRKPDLYKIQNRLTVLDAIALAGGFNEYAKRDRVIVIRTTGAATQKFKVDLKEFIEKEKGRIFYLQPNDTVYVQ